MSFGTIIQQGKFTSDGNAKTLEIRSGVDWIRLINLTTAGAGGAGDAIQYEWFAGMGNGTAIKTLDDGTTEVLTANGFTVIDSSNTTLGTLYTGVTGITDNAGTPVVAIPSTAGLSNGDVVRMGPIVGGHQLGGIDFTIGAINPNVSFELTYMETIVNANGGSFHKVNYDPIYYPRARTIADITNDTEADISFTVTHGYKVGQKIKLHLSTVNGMPEIDGQVATILAVNTTTNTVTVDIDTSGLAGFDFGLTAEADAGYTHAFAVPVGTTAGGSLDDATNNEAIIGMYLAPGDGTTGDTVGGPAGVIGDVIYWIAGKSE